MRTRDGGTSSVGEYYASMQSTKSLLQFLVVSLFTLAALVGCHFTPPRPSSFWKWKKDEAPVVPERILVVWSDSVLHQPGKPGVRGFGGRIYFYQTEGTEPVKVDGALAVYVFDADQLDPYQQKPLRKFVFTADQFAEHVSNSTLGPSYSIWLPWDEVGGEAKRLSLIARFEGREGGTVISDPVIKLLPGVARLAESERNANASEQKGSVRVVGHQAHSSEPIIPPGILNRRDIQTIDLPPSFQKHLAKESSIDTPQKHQTDNAADSSTVAPSQYLEPPVSSSSPDKEKRNIRDGKPIKGPRQG